MHAALPSPARTTALVIGLLIATSWSAVTVPLSGQQPGLRPMTFMDMQLMR